MREMKLEELASEAAKLSERERALLAVQLLDGLGSPAYDVSDEEVFARVREGEEDPSVMLSFDQLLAGLKQRGS